MNHLFDLRIALAELKRRKQKERMTEEDYNSALRILRQEYQQTKEKELEEEFKSSMVKVFDSFNIKFIT